jgi:hypothetical protein
MWSSLKIIAQPVGQRHDLVKIARLNLLGILSGEPQPYISAVDWCSQD